MSDSFGLLYVLAGLAFAVALATVPLAARRASRSAWWTQAGVALVVSFGQAGMMYWHVYEGYVPLWRCLAAAGAATVLPTLAAGWCARTAVRARPGTPYFSAALGALIGFCLLIAGSILATPWLIPDLITAVA
jgi:hypothetical protein